MFSFHIYGQKQAGAKGAPGVNHILYETSRKHPIGFKLYTWHCNSGLSSHLRFQGVTKIVETCEFDPSIYENCIDINIWE